MIQPYPLLLVLSFLSFFPFRGFAEIPVSNKDIQFSQQAVSSTLPLKKKVHQFVGNEEEIAFVQEPTEESSLAESLLNKLQGVQQEVYELRAQLDKQAQALKLLQNQQITFYKDLDSRVQQYQAQASGHPSDANTVPSQSNFKTEKSESRETLSSKVPQDSQAQRQDQELMMKNKGSRAQWLPGLGLGGRAKSPGSEQNRGQEDAQSLSDKNPKLILKHQNVSSLNQSELQKSSNPALGQTENNHNVSPNIQSQISNEGSDLSHIYSANEQVSYLAAYDLLKNKRFDDALAAMKIFTLQYPRGGYTANAQYWLGELYMVKNDYNKAIEHFEVVLKKFPLSSKKAASTLKIGYALAASGKIEEAKVRLEEVLRNYPDTPTAQLAITKLESLGVS